MPQKDVSEEEIVGQVLKMKEYREKRDRDLIINRISRKLGQLLVYAIIVVFTIMVLASLS